jgi:hypothetical protein
VDCLRRNIYSHSRRIFTRVVHAPGISQGQKWQRTQVAQKNILAANEVSQPRGSGFSPLEEEGGVLDFVLFPMYSQ